jgi:hypothetical protein
MYARSFATLPCPDIRSISAGGTQVKWNYQDGNLLASSHSNEVLIWDRRVSPGPKKILIN